jgi:hypothetical protein
MIRGGSPAFSRCADAIHTHQPRFFERPGFCLARPREIFRNSLILFFSCRYNQATGDIAVNPGQGFLYANPKR